MKKYLIYLMMAAAIVTFGACSPEDENEPQTPDIEIPKSRMTEERMYPMTRTIRRIPMTRINPETIQTPRTATAKYW